MLFEHNGVDYHLHHKDVYPKNQFYHLYLLEYFPLVFLHYYLSSNIERQHLLLVFSNIQQTVIERKDLEGDVVTTIEPLLEQMLEKQITQVQEKWSSDVTAGVIMDPKTGEIYAMSASPNFDPNSYSCGRSTAPVGKSTASGG